MSKLAMLVVVTCVLAATLRHGIPWSYLTSGDADHVSVDPPKSLFVRFITSELWLVLAPFVVAVAVGDFARNQLSVLPWSGFGQHLDSYGPLDAVVSLFIVVIADIWMFFGTAVFVSRQERLRLATLERQDESREQHLAWHSGLVELWRQRRKYYLIINVLVGLLLTGSVNPIYRLLQKLPSPEHCSLPGFC